MKFFKIKLWLARRSKKLDQKYSEEFRDWYKYNMNKIIENTKLSTKNIYFTKK